MKPTPMVEFTPATLARFKTAHAQAKAAGKDQFDFDGNLWLVSYAKYVIEYLDAQFARRPT